MSAERVKSAFSCPVCKAPLYASESGYSCMNSHNFDRAKSGYVNLLLSNQMNAKFPGDNKFMVRARRDFLDKGYYSDLLERIISMADRVCGDIALLDAGCGEGYYTAGVYTALKGSGRNISAAGVDISKFALNAAAKRQRDIEFAAGSVFHIPAPDSSCNLLMNIFAPFCLEEFSRVIENNGYMLMVIPGKRHLWQLKCSVYENPYENILKGFEIEGFKLEERSHISRKIFVDGSDIMNLFSMTPYYYKTSEKDRKKLEALENLETETEFEVLLYRKKESI